MKIKLFLSKFINQVLLFAFPILFFCSLIKTVYSRENGLQQEKFSIHNKEFNKDFVNGKEKICSYIPFLPAPFFKNKQWIVLTVIHPVILDQYFASTSHDTAKNMLAWACHAQILQRLPIREKILYAASGLFFALNKTILIQNRQKNTIEKLYGSHSICRTQQIQANYINLTLSCLMTLGVVVCPNIVGCPFGILDEVLHYMGTQLGLAGDFAISKLNSSLFSNFNDCKNDETQTISSSCVPQHLKFLKYQSKRPYNFNDYLINKSFVFAFLTGTHY